MASPYNDDPDVPNLSGSESDSDNSDINSGSDQDELGSNGPNDNNDDELSNHSDTELPVDQDVDEDEDLSQSDGSDVDVDDNVNDNDSRQKSPSTYPTSSKNPAATFKPHKKSHQSDPINSDFNNPENSNYLEKLNNGMRENFVITSHPESITHNYDDVKILSQIKRNASGIIDDPKHRMIPFITKYEMTRILGVRAQQIDNGAQPTIVLDNPELISGYFIAKQEFSQNKLPFIIKRSFPGNGGVEYWNVCDLDVPF